MVTGVETAGLVLAILPLLVNQLDSYVQGLQTIKSFRSRQFRRELDGYCTMLGTQQAILLNTLEEALEGIVDHEDEIRELMSNPNATLWGDPSFRAELRKKLGRDYTAFNRLMFELSQELQDLSRNLGLDRNASFKLSWSEASVAEREVMKFKTIFSKSIYNNLLSKINTTNGLLKTLVDQSHRRRTIHKKMHISKYPIMKHKKARKVARSLYKAMIEGGCWTCSYRHQHCIQFQLNTELHTTVAHRAATDTPKFKMVCISLPATPTKDATPGHEIEVESLIIQSSTALIKEGNAVQSNITGNITAKGKKRVKFAATTTMEENLSSTLIEQSPPCPPITDVCSILVKTKMGPEQRELLGFLTSESYRHRLYLVREVIGDLQPHSLEDILTGSSNRSGPLARKRILFNRRDRLFLAAKLACSVLQLHGSWLKRYWRARDIMFTKDPKEFKEFLEQPYLMLHIFRNKDKSTVTLPPLIRSGILFSLGLTLVELSLCCPISALRTAEDENSNEAVMDLNAASRHLNDVYMESGTKYGDVVEKCLFGLGSNEAKLEEDEGQEILFEIIVAPLLEDLRAFEGRLKV